MDGATKILRITHRDRSRESLVAVCIELCDMWRQESRGSKRPPAFSKLANDSVMGTVYFIERHDVP